MDMARAVPPSGPKSAGDGAYDEEEDGACVPEVQATRSGLLIHDRCVGVTMVKEAAGSVLGPDGTSTHISTTWFASAMVRCPWTTGSHIGSRSPLCCARIDDGRLNGLIPDPPGG